MEGELFMATEYVITLSDDNFSEKVLNQEGLVLVDFWAPWCGPCRMVGPVIEELAEDFTGKVSVGKLNVDENEVTAAKYQVMSIPTVILFKNGQPVDKLVGAMPAENYEEMMEKHLA